MQSIALKKYVGISRRKIARLARECIGLRAEEAQLRLGILPQKAAHELSKTIHSAASNFLSRDSNADVSALLIRSILVDNGPMMKRMMPRARGRADRILKRSSHIKVVLHDGTKDSLVRGPIKDQKKGKEVSNGKASPSSFGKRVLSKTKGVSDGTES